MVRRWSRLTSYNINLTNYKKLFFKYHFKSFRKSIIFRKLFTAYTKINRKHYSRLKHSYNWLIYSQIWQHWVRDYCFNKCVSKFYYKKSFDTVELLTYDPYCFNTKQLKLTYFSNQWSCGITKTFFTFTNSNIAADLSIFFKNSSLHYSYLTPITSVLLLKPILINLNGDLVSPKLYNLLPTLNFSFSELDAYIFSSILYSIKEIYLINSLLWFLLIKKNVK